MTTPGQATAPPPSGGTNWGKIALIGCGIFAVVLLILLVAGVGLFMLRKDRMEPVTTTAPTAPPITTPAAPSPATETYPGATVLEPGTFYHEANSSIDASDPVRPDGSYYEAYQIPLDAGQTVTVTMTSADFDAYLTAVSPSGTQTNDDDSGGGTNARLSLVTDEAGMWTFLANTLASGQSGGYSLVLEVR